MRFLVLGAGALGGYYGGMLQRGGADVTFLVRPRRAAQLRDNGLVVDTGAEMLRSPVRTVAAGELDGRYDVVLLACKTYDLDSATAAIAPAVDAGSAVLPILNGVGHIEKLAARFGRERVLGGLAMVNGELSAAGDITCRTLAPEHIVFGELGGERSARCAAIERAFAAGGVPGRISADIGAEMWGKLCLYAAAATIATLTRARAGEIAATAAGSGFVAAVLAECARVVTAEGHPPPADTLAVVTGIYAQPGSPYWPSVLVDVEAGKPTEADDTIGDLVRRADRRGIEAPLLRAALCSLQTHEARIRQRSPQ